MPTCRKRFAIPKVRASSATIGTMRGPSVSSLSRLLKRRTAAIVEANARLSLADIPFQGRADEIATPRRNGGPLDSGVSARGGRLRTCEVGRTRAGLGLVAAVERGIPVLSCQSPADGSDRAPSHGGRR